MYLRKPSPSQAITQSQPLDARQIPNESGGYVYGVDRWDALTRFLVIGTQGGTYYVGQDALTDRAIALVHECLADDGTRVVSTAVEVSRQARAIKQDYAVFAIALALADENVATRVAAYRAIPIVCRTATTLFALLSYLMGRRGWSAGLRRAVAAWYYETSVEMLAYQLVKYRDRNGFTHRDAMRLSHPAGDDQGRQALYGWAVGKAVEDASLPSIVRDYKAASVSTEPDVELAKRLPREALPTAWLNDPKIWEALLYGRDNRGMPLTALLRNLGNLSKNGVLVANSTASRYVVERLTDLEGITGSRIHPFALYLAAAIYGSGRSVKGAGSWAPVGAIVDALDIAFDLSFGNVKPTGKPMLVAVDVSGSMTHHRVANTPLCASDVAAAMALVTVKVEPKATVIGFDYRATGIYPIEVAADERLRDFSRRLKVGGGGTDCSLPFRYAIDKNLDVDSVVIYTDNETWSGQHPAALLDALRAKLRHRVKCIVASTTATASSIGDPADKDVFQMAGFDASAPTIIAEFVTR